MIDSSAVDTTALFRSALTGTSQQVVLKNDKLQLTLDTKGGVIRKAVIKNFKSIDGANDVTLFDKADQNLNFMLAGKQENIVTADLFFTPSEQTDSTVTMKAQAQNGGEIALKYRLGKRVNLTFDWRWHFTLSDKVDGLEAPHGISASGFKNKDSYQVTMLTLTYSFSAICPNCNKD